jgi:hypothetical protein
MLLVTSISPSLRFEILDLSSQQAFWGENMVHGQEKDSRCVAEAYLFQG